MGGSYRDTMLAAAVLFLGRTANGIALVSPR